MSSDATRGQMARRPAEIPRRGWKDILLRIKDEVVSDHVSVVSAGVAFFGLLAIFPAVAALISIAGYVLDPENVVSRLESALAVLPENAAAIIRDQLVAVTGGDETATGFAALIGLALALYGATKGMMTLMEGMNIAYDESEKRGFLALYATGIALTLFLIFGLLVTFGVMIVVPALLAFVGLPERIAAAINWLQWPLLAVLTVFGLAVLYRFGPSRENPRWRWVSPGAIVATVMWLVGTVAFSIYAQNFGSYNETYGTLGGVIVLLTWLWLSSFIVLLGAELNSEMEHQTRRDTTTGPEEAMGHRGAVKADTRPNALVEVDPRKDDVPPETSSRRFPRREIGDAMRERPVVTGIVAALVAWRLFAPRSGGAAGRGAK